VPPSGRGTACSGWGAASIARTLLGAAGAIGLLVSFVLAGALAGVATVVGGQVYDRRYRHRADALAGDRPVPAR